MSVDIGDILKDWPYEYGQVSARRIIGDDGVEKIQLRLDLGLLQMHASGRPDGQRPEGAESLLDYYQQRLAQWKGEHGGEEGFELDGESCEMLRAEGVMYYHRYLAEFILEDYEAVIRDAERNIRLMDFCHRHAAEESDRLALEQHRPYVIMMSARAKARMALRDDQPKVAMSAVHTAIEAIREFFRSFGQEKLAGRSRELSVLRGLAKEIEAHMPVDPVERVRRLLDKAVREERYEEAARLRDKLRQLTGKG